MPTTQTRYHPRSIILLSLSIALGLMLALMLPSHTVLAASDGQVAPPPDQIPMSDDACLECHSQPDMALPLPNGDILNLTVNETHHKLSIHGRNGYSCVQCHTDIDGFPHERFAAQSQREATVYFSQACANCHDDVDHLYQTGDHAKLIAEGDLNAATCVDCHGSHKLEEFGGSRTKIAQSCQKCHDPIYQQYQDSIHGEALINEFNPDVPTCIDCHENHANAGPNEHLDFHLFSPELCAKCHADEEMMGRYGINTDVFESYVADFHGTTITLFEQVAPDQETNKPVCIDCHGVHNILAPTDENSTVIKQNLLATCQRCHEDATPNFTDSWLSHYPPDAENHTIVFLVNLFYTFLIPGTLSIMGVFVATDIWRKIRRR